MKTQECKMHLEVMLDAGLTPDVIVECLADVCSDKLRATV